MPFQFRFRVLLQHRQYLVRKAQVALAGAQLRQDQAEARKRELQNRIDRHIQLWEQRQREGMPVGEFQSFVDYLTILEQQLLQLDAEVKSAVFEVEKAKQVLISREKDSKVLDSLKESDQEVYRYSLLKREQKRMDEVATYQEFQNKDEA